MFICGQLLDPLTTQGDCILYPAQGLNNAFPTCSKSQHCSSHWHKRLCNFTSFLKIDCLVNRARMMSEKNVVRLDITMNNCLVTTLCPKEAPYTLFILFTFFYSQLVTHHFKTNSVCQDLPGEIGVMLGSWGQLGEIQEQVI